jgi:threo-3-hydroxy-L-aspartate ammonia-lyase
VHGMATVPDEALLEAMRFVMLRMKQVVEPSGVLALAGVLTGAVPVPPGGRVGVIVSGGNVDADMLVRALTDPSTGVAGAGR